MIFHTQYYHIINTQSHRLQLYFIIIAKLNIMFDCPLDEENVVFDRERVKEDIASALQVLSQVSPSNAEVSNCNAMILNYLKQPSILGILFELLIDSSGNSTIGKLIITFVSAYIKKQTELYSNLPRHPKKIIIQRMRDIFFSQSVSHELKHLLEAPFTRLMSQLTPQFCEYRKKLCDFVIDFFQERKNTVAIKNCFYVIRALLNQSLETQNLRVLIQNLLMNFLQLSVNLAKQLTVLLHGDHNQNLTQQIQWFEQIIRMTELLYLNATESKASVLKEQAYLSSEFANLCQIVIEMNPKGLSYLIIPNNPEHPEWQSFNRIKTRVTNMVRDTFTILLKNRRNLSAPKYIPIICIVEKAFNFWVPQLAKQLYYYPSKPIPDEALLINLLIFFSQIIRIPHFLQKVVQIRGLVLLRIVFPCMLTTPKDGLLSNEDFCRMKDSIIDPDEENFHNAHQACAKLCESYAEIVDGSVTIMFKVFINLIDFHLTADPKYFGCLPEELVSSYFYENCNFHEQIETCLTILALLSYCTGNRADLCLDLEALIIRRQQFFSRIDISCNMIIAFLQCCSYYLENFYELILEGKISPRFHQALIFHALELMSASYDKNKKDFFEDERGKVGHQARDYLQNAFAQKLLFAAIFPAYNSDTPEKLVTFFNRICTFLNSQFGPKIIEDFLIDFVRRQISRTYSKNFADMSPILKNQLAQCLISNLVSYYNQPLRHESICKMKIFQLLKLLCFFINDPSSLLRDCYAILDNVVQKQFTYMDEIINIIQVYVKRIYKENQQVSPLLKPLIGKVITKGLKISDDQVFEGVLFDLVLHSNLLRVAPDEIANALIQVFQQRKQQMDSDDSAELIMEKSLYLLLEICFMNFDGVAGRTWITAIDELVDYMRLNYVRQNTKIVGKAAIICLCCYVKNPQGLEDYLGTRMEGLWDIFIEDERKYQSKTEKKIASLKLLELVIAVPVRPLVLNSLMTILKSVSILIYYSYEKTELSWDNSDDQEDNQQDVRSQEVQKKDPWVEPFAIIRENQFLSKLPDECLLMRDVCRQINQKNPDGFKKFVQNLPVGLQNLLTNKIFNYKEGSKSETTKKIRTIFKVRKQ